MHEGRDVLAGQSWQRGQLIVAWDAVRDGAADPHDGVNVVMHEFAHQLDQDTGAANGAPYVGRGAMQQAWARVMNQEFDALHARLARAEPCLIQPYAATSPAEFFAVTTELFSRGRTRWLPSGPRSTSNSSAATGWTRCPGSPRSAVA